MKEFISKTTATMKEYNNKKWWIDSGIVREIRIAAEAVNAHYSKYEWVSVRECEDYEVETARRKGMPIVEIETPEAVTEEPEQKEEETEMKEFAMIEKRITEEAEKNTADTVFYIENGYFPTWAEEHRTDPDICLILFPFVLLGEILKQSK